METDLHFL